MTMRAHRGKQDWSKPFKLIGSKKVFDDLGIDNNDFVISINAKSEHTTTIANKQEIIVPKIETVRRVTEIKKFAKVQPDYIRISDQLNLPKLQNYELNEVDHVFIQGQAHKFKLNGKVVLNPEFLSKIFIELEKKAGKDPILPKNKQWMTYYVDQNYKEVSTMANYDQFTDVFYNYWKNRREELKFPMLRELWHPNPDEYNHLLAFKPRQKEKRSLRRNNRIPEDQIAQEMQQQFLLVTKIIQRIKFREELKLKQIQLQFTNFHNQCKQLFGQVKFFKTFDIGSRLKDKQKFKKFQGEAENFKREQMEEQQQIEIDQTISYSFDQKQSVAQFLSTVINIADTFGLNYDKIFVEKPSIKGSTSISQPQPIIIPIQLQTREQKLDYMNMCLYKEGSTVYRTFQQLQGQSCVETYIKSPRDIFEYKSREMQLYYFGSDDECDTKDLRKNISSSFKKFQQMKALSIDL